MPITKPMLAAALSQEDIDSLQYPLIATPKIDGIRCLTIGGEALSRKFKLIPNVFIRKTLKPLSDGLDGELTVGDNFQDCTSGIMSRDGEPNFTYWVFDYVKNGLDRPYNKRLKDLANYVDQIQHPHVEFVSIKLISSFKDLLDYEDRIVSSGYEGIILRTLDSPYKCGRSTVKQGWLLKIKRFVDDEAVIIGFEEMMHNENDLEKDELGYAKRSSAKDGKVPAGTLGKFLVRDPKTGVEFACGSGKGLTHELRKEIWNNRDFYLGKLIKYKYQSYGVKDAPRTPIWLGFRSEDDL